MSICHTSELVGAVKLCRDYRFIVAGVRPVLFFNEFALQLVLLPLFWNPSECQMAVKVLLSFILSCNCQFMVMNKAKLGVIIVVVEVGVNEKTPFFREGVSGSIDWLNLGISVNSDCLSHLGFLRVSSCSMQKMVFQKLYFESLVIGLKMNVHESVAMLNMQKALLQPR